MSARKHKMPPPVKLPSGRTLNVCLDDVTAAQFAKRIEDVIVGLKSVKLATQIGLPCSPTWRYRSREDARLALAALAVRLATLAEEYPK